ncbi:MAG: hypothetical protein GC185_01670 [Alphaproteobacteria bacterium]|nr:hypothetical protein [Alphaproteobacteria bacterium]
MSKKSRVSTVLRTISSAALLSAVFCLAPLSASYAGHFKNDYDGDFAPPYKAWPEGTRTANRTPSGNIIYPQWLIVRPEHYGFLPMTSNWDAQNKHPQQWAGQDWDPAAWNAQQWTPEIALKKFYQNGILTSQYTRQGNPPTPVLEVGPRFYKLSDLDQRRVLKLLSDYTGVFNSGCPAIELHDWYSHKTIGTYTPQGMFLN